MTRWARLTWQVADPASLAAALAAAPARAAGTERLARAAGT